MMTIDEYITAMTYINIFDDEPITGFGLSVIDDTGKETKMKGVLEYPYILEFWDGRDAIVIGKKNKNNIVMEIIGD